MNNSTLISAYTRYTSKKVFAFLESQKKEYQLYFVIFFSTLVVSFGVTIIIIPGISLPATVFCFLSQNSSSRFKYLPPILQMVNLRLQWQEGAGLRARAGTVTTGSRI